MKNTKLFISALCLLLFGILISCGGAETPEVTTSEHQETEAVPEKEKTVIIAERGKGTEFQLVYGLKDDESPKAAFRLANLPRTPLAQKPEERSLHMPPYTLRTG